ncbi:MAG: transcriptional regulator NrdR [Pirellulales bacterium]|nr:transcriptional regulator NrdR [Pirellulales bacterium]
MRCPFCRLDNDKVLDSRSCDDGFSIRRRRECQGCFRRFTTYEHSEEAAVKVVKRDGSRIPYDRQKIKAGLTKACWKRPISEEQIEALVTAVERNIYDSFETEVETSHIGELVMQELRKLDQVAFVRFASVYRKFQDVRDFVDELQPILAETQKTKR